MSKDKANSSEEDVLKLCVIRDQDYIISQSSLTALSVFNGETPSDARIGLSKCSGKTIQKWHRDGNCLLWGGNPSYCLVPKDSNNTVTLGCAKTSPVGWTHDEAERLMPEGGHRALDVPWRQPRSEVIVYPKHGGINQKWWAYSDLEASLDGVLPVKYPFSAKEEESYKQELARTICNWLTPACKDFSYKRDVNTFPGLVCACLPRVTRKLCFHLSVLGQARDLRMTAPQDWQATNLYAAPNEVIEIMLPHSLSHERASQIKVRVSAHTDRLEPNSPNVKNKGKFFRMPIVSDIFDLEPGENKICSQFGGHLIFVFSDGENFLLEAEVKNVVESPYFRLNNTIIDQWKDEVKKDVPFSLLESDHVVALIRKSDAQHIVDPNKLMERYDKIISMLNHAAGFDQCDPPPRGKFWLVNDAQISAGSAHAGFPAMFDRTHYNLASDNTPYDWVTWHILGRNYQQLRYWARAYGSDSTVNLYSLYIQKLLFDEDRLDKEGVYKRAADRVDEGMSFADADVWEKLVFLMEIKWAFPAKDWEMFRLLRKKTRALSDDEAETLAKDEQKQYDHVYKNLSKIVGSDLIGTYNRWKLKISLDAQNEVASLGLPKAPGDLSRRK